MKHISDAQVCQAYADAKAAGFTKWPYELLAERTSEPEKVCYRACERAENRGLIDSGVTLRSGWLTAKGEELLATQSAPVA